MGCSGLTSVTIPDSVTSIGNSAFVGCSSLTSINIPYSVSYIGGSVFSGCGSLTSVIIPDGVTSIGDYAFRDCSNLISIVIPDGVTSIGEGAFSNCSSLKSINVPDSVTSIGEEAFSGCSSLTSINIPDRVISIGSEAFMNCRSLTSITIPDSVRSIGYSAFHWCNGLKTVTIADSVTDIDHDAFAVCKELIIYAEAATKPSGWTVTWESSWNSSKRPVVWGYIASVGEVVTGYNLTIQSSGDISVNLKMTLSSELLDDEDAYVKVTVGGEEKNIPLSDLGYDPASGQYVLSTRIAAKDVSTQITATVYNRAGECGASRVYSAASYAEYILEHRDEYDENLVAMMKAMLNYGATDAIHTGIAADSYFGKSA